MSRGSGIAGAGSGPPEPVGPPLPSDAGEELALNGFSAGIAHHARGATGQRDRMVSHQLKSAQRKERHQIADVETVGRGIEAAIESHSATCQPLRQFLEIGAVGQEPAPLQFVNNAHQPAQFAASWRSCHDGT